MKRHISIAVLLAFASLPLAAQSSQPSGSGTPQATQPATPPAEPPASQGSGRVEGPASAPPSVANLFGNFINLNLQSTKQSNDSSKFEEYRDLPEGLAGPAFRIFGNSRKSAYLISGENLMQKDRRLTLWVDSDVVRVSAMFDVIPHRLGNDAKSVEKIVSPAAQGISDYVQAALQSQLEARWANPATRSQINYAYLKSIVEPLLNTPEIFDLGFTRQRASLSVGLFPNAPFDTTLSLFQENRDGTRSSGTSFGFGNVVETAEPIQYRTRDVRLSAETPLMGDKLLLRGSVDFNDFQNAVDSYTFDNPFRVTHATDPSAYQAPASASVNGAAFGRISLPPDNRQLSAGFGGVYRMPMNSRLTADLVVGRLVQDQKLLPYTTNQAIIAANPVLGAPPEDHFDGQIDTTSLNVAFNTRPFKRVNLVARYRMYDVDNKSGRIETPGFVAFDATFQPGERISVPYGWRNNRAEIVGTYDLSAVTLEAGFRNDVMSRDFRETRRTAENIFHLAADLRPFTWVVWRNSFEFGNRDYDAYDQLRGESASFLEEEQGNIPGLKRFDQARRDTQRIVSMLTVSPFDGDVSVSANYIRYFDDYSKDTQFGLQTWRNQSFTLEADYTPSERWNAFGFYSNDRWNGFQKGRQSGATFSINPLDDWSAALSDRANTFGAGLNVVVVPDKANLQFSGRLQTVSGYGNFDSPPGGAPDVGVDIPNIDDTKLATLTAELTYQLARTWDLAVGAWVERYKINDALNAGTEQYLPSAFFLAPNDLGYRGGSAYVRTTYKW